MAVGTQRQLPVDIAIGLTAGLVTTAMTGPVQNLLDRFTPEDARKREEKVRPGPPTQLAAERLDRTMGAGLDAQETERASTAIHYAAGIPWGAAYTTLRRQSGMSPVGAALVTGGSMSFILDEGLTPAFGFSAPDRNYPIATHLRGFVAHLLFGAVVAATAEVLYRLTGTAPALRITS